MDVKKINETVKKAGAEIKRLRAENASLISKAGTQQKYAAMVRGTGKRKVGEVVAEVVEEIKTKLEELQVPEEAVEQAVEVVETAVLEAVLEAGTEEGMNEEVADVIDQETKDELAQVASSDEIEDEEIKLAAAKLLKNCNSKQAFGKEIVRLVKKMSAGNFSGSVVTRRGKSAGHKSQALLELQDFARQS